jgi:hypothetical protein
VEWIELAQKKDTRSGLFEHGNDFYSYIKCGEFLEELTRCQVYKGLCFIETDRQTDR